MEKAQENNQNKVNKKEEKFSKLSNILKKNLLRRKAPKKQIENSRHPEDPKAT